jgi:hypothetical protein
MDEPGEPEIKLSGGFCCVERLKVHEFEVLTEGFGAGIVERKAL